MEQQLRRLQQLNIALQCLAQALESEAATRTYSTTPRTEEIIKPVNCRVLMGRRPRFLKEGALFNAGVEAKVPGPGTYDADKIISLGRCKVSKEKDPPRWTMAKKSIMEFAKTHC
ncbi:unnamed protein product [Symbiodinium pilosum]|uniref:Uncharacterized protein n=1 Tax=Symbiodinium pilosum TaxID=2952 RepID=A0A812KGX1_SYMPI|nr:unnamed protein product [Symbiodinium pilosum]